MISSVDHGCKALFVYETHFCGHRKIFGSMKPQRQRLNCKNNYQVDKKPPSSICVTVNGLIRIQQRKIFGCSTYCTARFSNTSQGASVPRTFLRNSEIDFAVNVHSEPL